MQFKNVSAVNFTISLFPVQYLSQGGYKVRKEPSLTKRCEKMRKERKRCEKSQVSRENRHCCLEIKFFKEGVYKT